MPDIDEKKIVKKSEKEEPVTTIPKITSRDAFSNRKRSIIGKVISGKLNVREEPDVESDVLVVLDEGTPVVLDSMREYNGFYKVTAKGVVGYCMKDFIELK